MKRDPDWQYKSELDGICGPANRDDEQLEARLGTARFTQSV